MNDKTNPDKSSAGTTPEAGKPAGAEPGKAADPKRPYATIDLKAVEIGQPKPKTDAKAAPPPGAPAAASAAKPDEPKTAEAGARSGAAAEKPKASDKPTAAAPAARSGGVGSALTHLMAGLVGGAMAWYGITTIGPQFGLPGQADPKASEALQSKLAQLEKALSDRATIASGDIAAKLKAAEEKLARLDVVNKTLAELSAAQAKLAADGKALAEKIGSGAGADDAVGRISKLEEQLRLMGEAAKSDPQAGKLPQLAAISGSVSNLEDRLNHELAALRKSVSQELEQRLSLANETSEAVKSGTNRIDRDLAQIKSAEAMADEKVAKLRGDVDRLGTAVQGLRDDGNANKTALEALKSDVDARLKAVAKPADVVSAVAPVAGKLATLEQNVATVVKSEEERKTNSERVLLALELTNLKRVLERGQPFAAELANVTKAAQGKVDLTILERFKDTGMPTLAALEAAFGPVASAIVDAGTEAQPTQGSFIERVMAGAKSVMRVRKISYDADDKSSEAVAGRMEAALKDGRMADVLAEAKNIPAKAQAAAQPWLVKIEARASVERAIASLETALKTSIAGAPKDPAAPAIAPKG